MERHNGAVQSHLAGLYQLLEAAVLVFLGHSLPVGVCGIGGRFRDGHAGSVDESLQRGGSQLDVVDDRLGDVLELVGRQIVFTCRCVEL